MKTRILSTARLSFPLATALAALLASQHTHAATIYYDGRSSQTWNSNASWSTSPTAETPNLPTNTRPGAADDVIFNIVGANNTITMNLAGNQSANSMLYRSTGGLTIGANTSTGGTGTKTLTIGSGGITKELSSGVINIGTTSGVVGVVVGAEQTWTNNSATALNIGTTFFTGTSTAATLGLADNTLNLGGDGDFQFGSATTTNSVISGTSSASLIKNGAGTLTIGGANSYSGAITISGGTLLLSATGSSASTVTIASSATGGVSVAASEAQHVSTGEFSLSTNSTLRIDYGSNPPNVATAPLSVNTFTLGTGITLQMVGSVATGVPYPLVTWTTTGPPDTAAANAAFNPILVNGLLGSLSVSGTTLSVTFTTPPVVSWNTGDGTWDTSTENWLKDGFDSTFTNLQDQVIFGDGAPLSTGDRVVTLDSTLSPFGMTMNTAGRNYTISGAGTIAGAAGLTLASSNSGTLTLATANTYTGATQVDGGTLRLGNGGTLGSLAPSSPITLSAAGTKFEVNQSDTVTQGIDFGVISGNGSFSQTGIGGTTVLNSVNTFTGPISVTNGTLQIGAAGRLGGGTYAGDIGIATGLTFEYGGTATQTLSGIISGLGSLVKASGSGILTLSGENTYEGTTTINGGTLRLAELNAIASTSAISMADGSILQPTLDGVIIDAPITLGATGTTAQINGPFTQSAGGTVETLTLNQPITGDGNLRLFGSSEFFNTNGTIVLNAQSSYTGSTELDTAGETVHLAGVNLFVKLGIANALPTTTLLTLDGDLGRGSGRTVSFDLNGFNQTLAGLASNTTLTARNQRVTNTGSLATLTIHSSSDSEFGGEGPSSTFNGNPVNPTAKITGNLALTKTGTAKFTLLGVHEYTGDTTVSQGILSQEAPNTLNETSTVTIDPGAELNLNFEGTDTVGKLFIGSNQLAAPNVYGKTGSVFPVIGIAQITGEGTLTVTTGPGGDYATWADDNAGGQGPELDFDKDGVRNGVEFFMNAVAGFTANPQLNASKTITWPNGGKIPASAYGTQFVVQTSSDLSLWTKVLIDDPNLINTNESLSYTLTGGSPRFVRLSVTPTP
jgi:autotransporter-associated beta strand protein